ncbi:MAG: RAMP superfamily CRISPR-associated protein [Candidatus Helarchaeota archaeon]
MTEEIKKWNKNIAIELYLDNLRIGGIQQYSNIKLPIFRENNDWVCINLCSSFKGALRNSIRTMINSIKLSSKLANIEVNLLGSVFGNAGRSIEGKLQFNIDYKKTIQNNNDINIPCLYGIKINNLFNSTESASLFNYEFLNGNIKLYFHIIPIIPLTEIEAAVLLGGLKFLYLRGIGGFNSKGIGIIKNVKIQQDFEKFAHNKLKQILEGK